MEKNCRNCKWSHSKKCTRGLPLYASTRRGHQYSEDGELVEALREELKIKDIADRIINVLRQQGLMKPTVAQFKKLKTVDYSLVEEEIYEFIDEALYKSLDNYFDGECEIEEIMDLDEFYCSRWE